MRLDISRTFPHLCMFQTDGPLYDALHNILTAYAVFRPDVGYVCCLMLDDRPSLLCRSRACPFLPRFSCSTWM